MNDLFEQVYRLLQQVEVKRKEALKRGERFNMFKVCGVNHYENTHSAILAELLCPLGSHGQEGLYLNLFLRQMGMADVIDTNHVEVFNEYSIGNGRIDILIKDAGGHAIIIENKIYASDQQEQLKRYNDYAVKEYGNGKFDILYLTLYGNDASQQSAGDVEYRRISYAREITSWLSDCIEKSASLPLVRETLIQYRNHINQLTNQDMKTNEKQELLNLMVAHAREVDALMMAQADYGKYVFENFVDPQLKEYAQSKGIIYERYNLFGSGSGRGLFFRREQWKGMAVFLYSDHTAEWDFYWGVSNYTDCDMTPLLQLRLNCFDGSPTEGWPYGWKYLEKYRNWNFADGTFTAMIEGDFAKYVMEQVDIILDEIDCKKIVMI